MRFDLLSKLETLELLSDMRQRSRGLVKFSDMIAPMLLDQPIRNSKSKSTTVKVIELEEFTQFLSQQLGREPSLAVISELQSLFCIDVRYPGVLLANKMDKVISSELDVLYVNLLRGLKEGDGYYSRYVQKGEDYSPKIPQARPQYQDIQEDAAEDDLESVDSAQYRKESTQR